jgi:hypothetical protein
MAETTTTTTTLSPLAKVETVRVDLSSNELEINDASDSLSTVRTSRARSFSFGTVPPGGESDPVISFLRVPFARAIGNVKIALIDTGSITFANNIFGITSSAALQDNVEPAEYFQGINVDNLSSNVYNVSLDVKNVVESNYVYLFVNMPSASNIGHSVIRYKWFFDYSS